MDLWAFWVLPGQLCYHDMLVERKLIGDVVDGLSRWIWPHTPARCLL